MWPRSICSVRVRTLKQIGRNGGKPVREFISVDPLVGDLTQRRQIGDDATQVAVSQANLKR
jgi:hypothetical protein